MRAFKCMCVYGSFDDVFSGTICSSRVRCSGTHLHMQTSGARALEPPNLLSLHCPICIFDSHYLFGAMQTIYHASLYKTQHLTVIIWSNSKKWTKVLLGIVLNMFVRAISVCWVYWCRLCVWTPGGVLTCFVRLKEYKKNWLLRCFFFFTWE